MRKSFAAMMALMLVLGSILPASIQPASAYAPPPPTLPAATPPPAEPGIAGQILPTPPSLDSLPPEVEEARARQAIEAVLEKHLRYWGPRYQVAPVEVTVEGEWAHGVAQWRSQARTLKEPIHVLAQRLPDGTWQALMPSSDGLYLQWVDAVPESLVLAGEKGQLRAQAAEADAVWRVIKPPVIITSTTPSSHPSLPSESLGPIVPTPVPLPQPETWIAGETSVSRLSEEEHARLCGVPVEVIEWERLQASRETARPEAIYSYPSAKDWRNVNGQDWTTAIRSQGGCGSCVAFGTIGAIESRMEVANGNPGLNPDLSEAHLFFCGCGECCGTGWYPDAALNFSRDTGVVDDGCYPYTDHDQACSPCSGWQSRVSKIASWIGTSNVAEVKQALADYGPFEATMAVYDDFFSYSGGIYHHTWGNLAGYHAVTIVGYDDNGSYWIVKNSWDTGWGEDGWFRIAYGECGIDDYAYVPNVSPPPSCDPNADQIALFVDANYSGQCVVKGTGQYPNPGAVGLPNDSISSIKVGGNVQAILCEHDGYGGVCETFTGDDPDLSNNSIGNDRVSSAKVEQRSSPCNPNADQVALYADTNHGGSCVTLGVGDYPNPGHLGGLGNDNAESIRVGSNVQAILYEHDNYGGRSETFTGDDSNLWDNTIGGNVVSSVKVQWRAQPPAPPTLQSPANGTTFNEGQGINLSWSSTGNEYYGEVWGGPGGTLTFGWQGGTSKDIGSQWAGYTYSWHVKARNGAGESGWSDTWTFTVKPAAPSNLSAQTASCSQINLYWDDNSGNEEGYKVYRDGSYVGQVGMNTTSYQDTGLSENTSYSHYVKAFRGSIESNASNTVNITTPPCAPPQPDLVPSQWGGWQYPIVPSSITGTSVVNTLYANYPTYIDWGISNSGNADCGGDAYGDLYFDDTLLASYNFGDVQAGWTWAFFDWPSIVVDTPGWHTLKFVADPDGLIA